MAFAEEHSKYNNTRAFYLNKYKHAQKWLEYRAPSNNFLFIRPTSDGNISETVYPIYLQFGMLRVPNVNS